MIYFLAAVAAIAGFLFGYDEGVIAVVRPSLDKDFPMGPLVGGFMTAAVPLGALAAASVAGRIVDRFGRRRVLMAAAALFALGALIAAAITAIWMLVMARLVLGLAIGVAAVGAPLYIAETAPLRIRGALVSTYQLAITIGILVSYLTGLVVSGDGTWRTLFGLGAVPGLLFLAGLAFLPESPRWLVLKGFPGEARASLRRLRAQGWDVDGELDEMVRTAEAATGRRTGYRALLEPAIRPALIVAVGLFFLQQLSGINAVIYYAPEIFSHAGFDSVNTQMLATVGVGTVNLLTTVLAMFLIDRIGRRPLLIVGFAGTSAAMLVIAACGGQPDAGAVMGHHRGAVVLYRLFRHQPGTASARHDVGGLPAARAWTGHEHGIDQQLGLQLHRGLRLPVDAGRPGSRLHLHDLRRHLPGRNPLHAGAGAGNHGAFARSHRDTLPLRSTAGYAAAADRGARRRCRRRHVVRKVIQKSGTGRAMR